MTIVCGIPVVTWYIFNSKRNTYISKVIFFLHYGMKLGEDSADLFSTNSFCDLDYAKDCELVEEVKDTTWCGCSLRIEKQPKYAVLWAARTESCVIIKRRVQNIENVF